VFEYAKKQSIDEVRDSEVPWYTLVEVLGQLSCNDSVPWLLELLTHVEGLTPIGEDNRVDMLREEIVYSLGQIRDSRALEPLLERVRTYENEWIVEPIRALGHLGDPGAVEHLLPFLNSKKDWMKEEAVRAICRIGSEDVYEPLAKFYFEELEEYGLSAIHHRIEDALVSMDIKRTERLVLKHIEKKELSEDEIGWRMMYIIYRVASEACIETVFPYLKNKTFYLQAAEILWRVELLELEDRMKGLLKSEDPHERAAAVWYMSRKWGKDLLNELKKFEDDPDRVVRRAVADLYNYMHNATGRSSLLRMVNDEDLVVLYTVYTAHIGESIHFLDSSWVCFGDEAHKARYVLLAEGGILAWLDEKEEFPQDEQEEDQSRKLLFIEAKYVTKALKVELSEEDFGLYVVTETDAERREYLIKPENPFGIIDPDRELSTFLHELVGISMQDLGPLDLADEESKTIRNLWELCKDRRAISE
jgi:HEAT repeat protein